MKPTNTTSPRQVGQTNINGVRNGKPIQKDFALSSSTLAPKQSEWTLPRRAWVRFNRLRTGDRLFHSTAHKWDIATSLTCECGAEEQTADHVINDCPIFSPPNGVHGLRVLDDETKKWLLETGLAV